MNRILFTIALAAISLLASCSKADRISNQMEGQVTEVEFMVPEIDTKSTTEAAENAVRSLQIFVFGADDKIEAYGQASNSTRLSLTCTTGDKTIVALVNATAQTGILRLSDLTGRKSDMSDNSSSNFVMEGKLSKKLTVNETVTVPVSRVAAKVVLKSVSTNFELEIYRNMEFKLTRVMLTNVVGNKTFLGQNVPEKWYNKQGASPNVQSLYCDAIDNVQVTAAIPYAIPHYLYCYPNPTETDSSDATWCARHTRLVVSATLGGGVYHYPVTLPVLESNKQYFVSLTVTRPGSYDIDVPIEKLDENVSITVTDWKTGGNVNETI